MNITMNVGKVVIIIGLSSKPRDIALPIRDIISNDRAREMPKNIFLPKVVVLLEPKIKIIANKIIATRNTINTDTSRTPPAAEASSRQ